MHPTPKKAKARVIINIHGKGVEEPWIIDSVELIAKFIESFEK